MCRGYTQHDPRDTCGITKLIVQRGAYTTNKLIQSASQKTKLVIKIANTERGVLA